MARVHGSNGRIYVAQYNLSGRANKLDLGMEIDVPEVTAFEDVGKAFVAGRPGWDLSVEAFADYVDDEIDEIIAAIGTSTVHVGAYFGGPAAGSVGYEGVGALKSHARMSENADAAKMKFDFMGAEGVFLGRACKLNEATVVTGTGAQTGLSFMAAATGALVVFTSRVIAVTGAGSITMVLQESSDGGGDPYATAVTNTAQTTMGSVRGTAVAGATLGPFWRTNVTAFSGFTDVTIRTSVAIVPPRA